MKNHLLFCLFIFGLSGCTPTWPTKNISCGKNITTTEATNILNHGNRYMYTDEDLDLLADITTEVNNVFKDSLEIEVFFFKKNKTEIGLYVFGPEEIIIAEKAICRILDTDIIEKLPKNIYIFYYPTEIETVMVAVRNN